MANKQSNYWFGNKRYGYGWMPNTWQGWLVVLIYLVFALGLSYWFGTLGQNPGVASTVEYIMLLGGSTMVLLAISIKKGPKPHWQWGKDK